MRPISSRLFLKRTGRAGQRLANWRVPAGACAPGKVSRHVSWTLGIIERLVRRKPWLGLHPEAMVLAGRAQPWILVLKTLLRQARPNESKQWPQARPQAATLRQVVGGRIQPAAPSAREAARNRAPRPVISVVTAKRGRTAGLVGKISDPQRARSMTGDAPSSGPLVLSLANRVIGRPRLSRREEGSESETSVSVSGVSTRVMRKHRRVEERPFMRHPELAAKSTAAWVRDDPVVIKTQQPRLRTQGGHESNSALEPRAVASQPQSAVNVAQITDAVIQQLDRRLIAARERKGRI